MRKTRDNLVFSLVRLVIEVKNLQNIPGECLLSQGELELEAAKQP